MSETGNFDIVIQLQLFCRLPKCSHITGSRPTLFHVGVMVIKANGRIKNLDIRPVGENEAKEAESWTCCKKSLEDEIRVMSEKLTNQI